MSSQVDTRTKIVEAASRLLSKDGPDGVTTRNVAEAAGVQAPAIYRIFGDKDGLLDAVAEHVMANFASAKADTAHAAAEDDTDPLDDLRDGWQTYVDFGLANPALFPLLNDPDRARRSPATQSGRLVLETRVHRLALAGRLRVSERRAVDLIHAAGSGTVLALLSTPVSDRDRSLADEMFETVLDRIVAKARSRAKSTPRGNAVALRAALPQLDVLSDAERQLLADWLDRISSGPQRIP